MPSNNNNNMQRSAEAAINILATQTGRVRQAGNRQAGSVSLLASSLLAIKMFINLMR